MQSARGRGRARGRAGKPAQAEGEESGRPGTESLVRYCCLCYNGKINFIDARSLRLIEVSFFQEDFLPPKKVKLSNILILRSSTFGDLTFLGGLLLSN